MNESNPEFRSRRLVFRYLTAADVSDKYIGWLKDIEINRWMEIEWYSKNNTVETCLEFVESSNQDPHTHLMGIFLPQDMNHIGNIKLYSRQPEHGKGELGIVIGEKKYWRFGYGSEAIEAFSMWAFNTLHLERLEAMVHEKNVGSLRAFKRAGFLVEGYLRNNANPPPSIEGPRRSSYILGLIREDKNLK